MNLGLSYYQDLLKRDEIKSFISRSWSVSWPMTLIMFFEFLINLTDVFIAGKISKEIQAAYGFVTQIYFIFTVIGNALTVGTVSVISRLCQSMEDESYSKAVFSTVVAASVAGLFLGIAGIFLTPIIFNFLDIPEVLKQFGRPLASMVLFIILSALPENNIEIVAAFTNGLRIEAAIFLPAFAFNMSNAVVVGNLLGEKKKNDAFKAGLVTASIGVGIVTMLTIAVILNARFIVSLLSNNEIVIKESVKYLYICMISEPFMAWGVILGGGLNGAGDTRAVMIIVALSVWLVRIPLSYVFGVLFGLGAIAVWWSMNTSLFVQAFFISRRYFNKRWLSDRI